MSKEKAIDLTVDLKKANSEGTLTGILLVVLVVGIGFLTGAYSFDGIFNEMDVVSVKLADIFGNLSVPVLFVGILVAGLLIFYLHEVCHFIIYALFLPKEQKKGLKIKMVKFLQMCVVIPNGRMSVKLKILGQIFPFLVLGIGLLIVAVIVKSPLTVLASAVGAGAAGEDVLASGRLLKCLRLKNAYCVDCPDRVGCVVYYEDEKDEV